MSAQDTGSIAEYMELKKGLSKYLKEATEFTPEDLEIFHELLNDFKGSWSASTNEKGKSLETLVTFIFERLDIFEVFSNIRTSTNEIDQLVTLSPLGKTLVSDGLFDIKGLQILSECKNYEGRVNVTWVGKFCNLLMDHPARIGIVFSRNGFTGRGPWSDAKGLAKKFYYRKENPDQRMYVIDINLIDLEKMADGVSFIEILEEKIMSLENDTNYEDFLTTHPAQENKLSS